MLDILLFMAPAICMCIILVGICGYVGIHVVIREVIFIDIALAQIAALGTSFGLFWGFEISSIPAFIISLTFTFLAALILSLSRKLSAFVPQEAFIGILYATGAAAVLLAGDRLPHGNEHVHDLMCGHLLWVNWKEVGLYLLIYIILGLVYCLIHKKLLEISQISRSVKNNKTRNSFILWDFIFYALLGLLVTFAVRIAGVLLVFGFLIVPAVIGSLVRNTFHDRLKIGWISGVIISLIGSYFSYIFDFPTGATVVVCLGVALLFIAIIKGIHLRYR
jgi:zinc/manganese transport system permease protein